MASFPRKLSLTSDLQMWDALTAPLRHLAQGGHSVKSTEGAGDGTKLGIIWIHGLESNKDS